MKEIIDFGTRRYIRLQLSAGRSAIMSWSETINTSALMIKRKVAENPTMVSILGGGFMTGKIEYDHGVWTPSFTTAYKPTGDGLTPNLDDSDAFMGHFKNTGYYWVANDGALIPSGFGLLSTVDYKDYSQLYFDAENGLRIVSRGVKEPTKITTTEELFDALSLLTQES